MALEKPGKLGGIFSLTLRPPCTAVGTACVQQQEAASQHKCADESRSPPGAGGNP